MPPLGDAGEEGSMSLSGLYWRTGAGIWKTALVGACCWAAFAVAGKLSAGNRLRDSLADVFAVLGQALDLAGLLCRLTAQALRRPPNPYGLDGDQFELALYWLAISASAVTFILGMADVGR